MVICAPEKLVFLMGKEKMSIVTFQRREHCSLPGKMGIKVDVSEETPYSESNTVVLLHVAYPILKPNSSCRKTQGCMKQLPATMAYHFQNETYLYKHP
jgi:hypothetical protein